MMPAPLASGHDQPGWGLGTAVFPDNPVPASASRDDASAARLRASSRGSGRNSSHSTRAPEQYARLASFNGPARAGKPISVATLPVALTRLGPRIAPTAVATSTMLTARPRRDGAARSAPA